MTALPYGAKRGGRGPCLAALGETVVILRSPRGRGIWSLLMAVMRRLRLPAASDQRTAADRFPYFGGICVIRADVPGQCGRSRNRRREGQR